MRTKAISTGDYNAKHKDKLDVFGLVVFGLFFLILFIAFPTKLHGDSLQYLNGLVSREPAYPLLLRLLSLGGADYEIPLKAIQNALAFGGCSFLYCRVARLFNQKSIDRIITIIILLSPHIMTPVTSVNNIIITSAVLTEGISISLYYFYMGMALSMIYGYYKGRLKIAAPSLLLLSIIMSLVRNQMLMAIVGAGLVIGYGIYKDSVAGGAPSILRSILLGALAIVLAFVISQTLTRAYHYSNTGIATSTVSSKPMMLANMVYVSKEADIEAIRAGDPILESRLKKAFGNMRAEAAARGLTAEYAEGNILKKTRFYESGHEIINFECVTPELNKLIYELDLMDESDYNLFLINRDKWASEIIKKLWPALGFRYIRNYIPNVFMGFIRSVAVYRIYYIGIAVYILMAGLIVFNVYRQKRFSELSQAACFILLMIGMNAAGTALMIECLSRYMIYNLPIYYIILLELLRKTVPGGRFDKT